MLVSRYPKPALVTQSRAMKTSLIVGITVNILFLLHSPLVTAATINESVAPRESHPTSPVSRAPSELGPGPGLGLAKANSSESTSTLSRREENARFTYYEAGEGACGGWNSDSDCVVALNSPQWDGGSHCFKWINAYYQGNNVWAQIVDECPGCPWGALDMSKCAFGALASLDEGMVWGGWHYDGEGAKARDPPPPPPPPQQNLAPAPAPPPTPSPPPQPQPQAGPQSAPLPVDAFQPIVNVEVNTATPSPSTTSMSTTSTNAEISSSSASGGGSFQRAQATDSSSTSTRTESVTTSTGTAPTSDGTGPTTIPIPLAAELGAGIFHGGHIFHSGAASLEDLNWGFIVLGLLVSTIL